MNNEEYFEAKPKDNLKIANENLKSRLLVGTGKFANNQVMNKAIASSESQVVTMALRRIDFDSEQENVLNFIPKGCILLPNTSGARTADEAVRIAKIARAAGCGNWIKIEVIKDNKYLLPDNYETIKATEILAKDGFVVLPYMSPDLMVAKQLVEVGAAAVMPLGAPIGSNQGLQTKEMIRILINEISLPIIVDAGIGKPSQAAEAMELGAAAVLVNTAIATAKNPVLMAEAFRDAVKAGRTAYLAGPGATKDYADASSPLTGFLNNQSE
ncbi:thiazole synthase [Desulfuribacillus alkaliarsenatis]|uniref:Thiazole synthase n=1 Tax=Desulfuribacillus alkaliarsenatis TaxID=766136 RepID=A0A1E5G045_9FIRM|nr:thiazole synthase [Desulfuribacillus alkaliarsenatis]OEF96184.1 thiazole synthase [Desulfuribacillus alkaliarsenatis]